MEQAGAGGLGDPRDRPAELVLRDVCEGYVSPGAARSEYGVALTRVGYTWTIDEAETDRLRGRSG